MVTVVIPTYNHENFITHTFGSIYRQTYQNWRILIVDDASTDQTLSIVKRYADCRTKIIESKENMGICHVLNKALPYIDTKYFIQVDGDDWLAYNAIEKLLLQMENEDYSVAVAYGDSVHWHYQDNIDHFRGIRTRQPFTDRYEFVTFFGMFQPRFYRTENVKQVGGWETDDPFLGRMMEDRRMLLRLLDEYSFSYTNSILYHFRSHANNLSANRNASRYNTLLRLYTDRALKRWGGHYQAVYVGPPDSWQKVQLVPRHIL